MRRAAQMLVQPRPARVLLAFVAAPLVAAFVFDLMSSLGSGEDFLTGMAFMLMISLYVIVIFAVPLYFLLRGRVAPSIRNVIIAGVSVSFAPFIPALGWMIVAMLSGAAPGSYLPTDEFSVDLFTVLLMTAVSGLCGAIAFWFCAVWRDPRFENREAA